MGANSGLSLSISNLHDYIANYNDATLSPFIHYFFRSLLISNTFYI